MTQCHFLPFSTTARTSRSLRINSSSSSSLNSVPLYLANSTVSPFLMSTWTRLPLSRTRPGPTERTSPCCGRSLAVSGRTMPLLVVSSRVFGLTTTRSPIGLSCHAIYGLLITPPSPPAPSPKLGRGGEGDVHYTSRYSPSTVPGRPPAAPPGWPSPGKIG